MKINRNKLWFGLVLTLPSVSQAITCTYTALPYVDVQCVSVAAGDPVIVTATGSTFTNNINTDVFYARADDANLTATLEDITSTSTTTIPLVFTNIFSATGSVTVTLNGTNNTITNSEAAGDATLYLRSNGTAIDGGSTLNINGGLTINNQGDTESISPTAIQGSSEGIHLFSYPSLGTVRDVTLNVPSSDPVSVTTTHGTGLLADIDTSLGGQGNINLTLPANVAINSTSASGSYIRGAVVAHQNGIGSTGDITINTAADLSSTTTGVGSASILVHNDGNGDVIVNNTGSITGNGNSMVGIRVFPAAGTNTLDNTGPINVTGNNADGFYSGQVGNTAYSPTTTTITNTGQINIEGIVGGGGNHGIASHHHNTDTTITNSSSGIILHNANANGPSISGINNFDATANAPMTITNDGIIAYTDTGTSVGIIGDTNYANLPTNTAILTVNNNGDVYAYYDAFRLNSNNATLNNTGRVVSYFQGQNAGNYTVNNTGTWVARDVQNLANVTFNFGTGTSTFNLMTGGTLTVPGTSVANGISIPTTPPITVDPTIAADTDVTFNMGAAGVFNHQGGAINLQNSSPTIHYNVMTLNGLGYTANGGTLLIDSSLAGDTTTATDVLNVSSVTYTAPVSLTVSNTDGLGAPTTNGIEIINITGNSDGREFVLASNITVGDYTYRLLRRPLTSTTGTPVTTGATWLLANFNCTATPNPANADDVVSVACSGLNLDETVQIPGVDPASCIYDYTVSPGTVSCSAISAEINRDSNGDIIVDLLDTGLNVIDQNTIDFTDNRSCVATPDPRREGFSVDIQCTGLDNSETISFPGLSCTITNTIASCNGIAGNNVGQVPSNPVLPWSGGNINTALTVNPGPVCVYNDTVNPAQFECSNLEEGDVINIPGTDCNPSAAMGAGIATHICTVTNPGAVDPNNDGVVDITINDIDSNTANLAVRIRSSLALENIPALGTLGSAVIFILLVGLARRRYR